MIAPNMGSRKRLHRLRGIRLRPMSRARALPTGTVPGRGVLALDPELAFDDRRRAAGAGFRGSMRRAATVRAKARIKMAAVHHATNSAMRPRATRPAARSTRGMDLRIPAI